jgi:hypothetical protein
MGHERREALRETANRASRYDPVSVRCDSLPDCNVFFNWLAERRDRSLPMSRLRTAQSEP